MDHAAFAEFLRRRREALQPQDVGLVSGARRRAVGLRREEVAHMVGMSVDYVNRLEQGRSPQPPPQLVAALARALRLTDDQTDHLHRLAGHAAPDRGAQPIPVAPALATLLEQITDAPAFICSDTTVVLAQNAFSTTLFGNLVSDTTSWTAGLCWMWFTAPGVRTLIAPEEHEDHSRAQVADLRAAWGRRREDADMRGLVAGLLAHSAEFSRLWAQHEVAVKPITRVTFRTKNGPIALDCQAVDTTNRGQRLVLLVPPQGSPALERLRANSPPEVSPDRTRKNSAE